MDIASSLEFFTMVKSGKEDLLIMRIAGYYDANGNDLKFSSVTQTEKDKVEYRLKPIFEGKPYGQWIGLSNKGRKSFLEWYASASKVKLGSRIGLGPKPDEKFQPPEQTLDSHFKVGMEVLVNIKKNWIRSTILSITEKSITVRYPAGNTFKTECIPQKNACDRLKHILEQSDEKEKDDGEAIPYSSIKTWFDKLVQPEDFTCCKDVGDNISFKIEENFAIKLTRNKGEKRRWTGKVGHVQNQTFHVYDTNRGIIWIEFDLADFFSWDFDLTDVVYELKVADDGRKIILFHVTHVWVDLNEYSMEFFNQNHMVCRKQVIIPWFMSKWFISNAINWSLKSILDFGKNA